MIVMMMTSLPFEFRCNRSSSLMPLASYNFEMNLFYSATLFTKSLHTFSSDLNLVTNAVTFPLDLVRRRMQLEGAAGRARVYKSGIFGTFKHIVSSEGFRGLYRGILPEYYKVVPGIGIAFMTYETLKSCLSGALEST